MDSRNLILFLIFGDVDFHKCYVKTSVYVFTNCLTEKKKEKINFIAVSFIDTIFSYQISSN